MQIKKRTCPSVKWLRCWWQEIVQLLCLSSCLLAPKLIFLWSLTQHGNSWLYTQCAKNEKNIVQQQQQQIKKIIIGCTWFPQNHFFPTYIFMMFKNTAWKLMAIQCAKKWEKECNNNQINNGWWRTISSKKIIIRLILVFEAITYFNINWIYTFFF